MKGALPLAPDIVLFLLYFDEDSMTALVQVNEDNPVPVEAGMGPNGSPCIEINEQVVDLLDDFTLMTVH